MFLKCLKMYFILFFYFFSIEKEESVWHNTQPKHYAILFIYF